MKKLVKHGNSLALILDKPLLKILNITDKTRLEISIQDGSLIIKPKKSKNAGKNRHDDRTVDEIADRVLSKYKSVFKKLAKT